jgi:hypothetical protein
MAVTSIPIELSMVFNEIHDRPKDWFTQSVITV